MAVIFASWGLKVVCPELLLLKKKLRIKHIILTTKPELSNWCLERRCVCCSYCA